ncbi:MAG: FAD:protein FMN transferase [Pseudomonadota bacterium]
MIAVLIAGSGFSGCERPPNVVKLSGETMGTTYHVTVVDPPRNSTSAIEEAIIAALARVNQQLNNWDPQSEVSTFNQRESTEPLPVSDAFQAVMAQSFDIHRQSDGRFDVTLAPLIELWGFGPRTPDSPVPGEAAISTALSRVGMARLLTLDGGNLTKANPKTSVNLAAIAKGYGVDQIAGALDALGISNYLVEIGGDLITAGTNQDGGPWRVGIETPDRVGRSIHYIIRLSNVGMATSGDYRNFVEHEGKRYSHILDPVTGRPVEHRLASVTVLHETAALADGWATALLVLGDKAGMTLADTLGIAAYFIVRGEDDFEVLRSERFNALVPKPD